MHITVHCSLLDLAALRGYYLAYVRLIGVFKMKIFSKDSLAFSSKKKTNGRTKRLEQGFMLPFVT